MNLQSTSKIVEKGKKRVGRGIGSGRGKTSTRGMKGQNARAKLPITHPHFEGGQRPLFKRLPYRRGKGNAKISKKPLVVNLKALARLPKNTTVTIDELAKDGIVDKLDAEIFGVKILGDGDINVALNINLPISKSAAAKIEKAGGKIINKISNSNFESGSAKARSPKDEDRMALNISKLSTKGKGNIKGKPN